MDKQKRLLFKIGNRIKLRRVKINMSQKDLAEAIEVTQSEVSRLEHGETNVTVGTLDKYCKVLGLIVKVAKPKKK